jgi:predicted enzyme related to lactoylglutathione lyase
MSAHGSFHWNELMTRDAARARQFYQDAIGWRFEGMPEGWMPYLAVDDVDARVEKAVQAGAQLMRPIFDVPEVGRIAILREPGGAGIGWMTPVAA